MKYILSTLTYHSFDVMNISLRFTTPVENSVFNASPTYIKYKFPSIKKTITNNNFFDNLEYQ
jgi:hypothetical protein